ncbi:MULTISPECIES: RagB/SusD family nutrient uptake outer membrane protein [Mesonia]|uniref:SusD-like protein n=1 Tax=Mesonia oceanica TaxID=2687242 RepID=A0AC61Y3K6_9FLAO|nr:MULTISPECIES: RagB/SusD family nutrient uptake outer membrane protein [Mesonia]MAN26945.1 RagB/SusD family nutrient uptake outer membrane protein [Mesonia sp.]MAQ40779.1 RagB/SusD family nutrient uptake outer membrane protein [Mesonia sp.]VVU99056.1 SusD-like protein [Mesonia oceanica]
MKFKLYTKIAIGILAGVAIISCSDDYLEVDARENIEASDSNENITPEQFVNGIYGMYTDWDYAFAWLGITEIISDNADKGSSPTDTGADKNLLDNLTFTSTAPSVRSMWTRWYKTIGRASYSIAFTRDYGLEDESYSNRLVGEAKFLRALTYFYLVRSFGDVPLQGDITIIDGEAIIDQEADLSTRNPKEEVYAYIEQDLLDAIDALPLKSEYAPKDLGRATKGAAQALLAKVHLYQKEYTEALQYANAVINSGEYGLETDYAEIWREYTENGTESIFEIQARGEAIAHGVNQYSQTQGARGTSGWGWGFNTPTENLVNAFDVEGDEIRKNATIIFAGETLWDGREVSASVENPMYNEKAYSSANAGASDGDKNIRVIRYAEVLLIKAEAANELGQTSEALSALNQVRSRVDLDNVSGLSQTELRDKIWNERRLELAFEHDRWFDLIRTGQAAEAMAANGKDFIEGQHELFPIPENQLIQTPEMNQNPGW